MATTFAVFYQLGMADLELQPRTFGEGLQWAVGTMTTTGFGRDTTWTHPLMEAYVIIAQFPGGDAVRVELDGSFTLRTGDVVHICGTKATIAAYFREVPGASPTHRAPPRDVPSIVA